jgi:FkbM family methyltransferase
MIAVEAIKSGLKKAALRTLPGPWILRIKKDHYFRLLRRQGPDEEKDFTVIARLVRPGDHVIDIGANYGVYMKFLAGLVGGEGKVYSVEPVPDTHEILSANVRRLQLPNVEILNCAFSDKAGEAVMEIPKLQSGGENYYMAAIVDGRRDASLRIVSIRTETLDGRFLDHPREIAFIKCDVEGHELSCLNGALGAMRKWLPAWCVEISGDPDATGPGREVLRIAKDNDYRVFWFDGKILRERRSGDSSVNYFFLQPRHLERVTDLLAPAARGESAIAA